MPVVALRVVTGSATVRDKVLRASAFASALLVGTLEQGTFLDARVGPLESRSERTKWRDSRLTKQVGYRFA